MNRPGFLSRHWQVLLLVVPLTVCCSPISAHGQEKKADRWAVLIGVDDYVSAKDLKYCGADVKALREKLIAAGFPDKQIKLLHSKATDSSSLPFKRNVVKQIDLILKIAGENDLVLLVFSGHGLQIDDKSYLCPADAELEDPSSLVSLDDIYEKLRLSPAPLKVVLVDACRNDPSPQGRKSLSGSVKAFAESMKQLKQQQLPEGVVLVNSCGPREISWEDEKFGHGVFMHYLLEGIDGKADKDSNHKVTLGELLGYAGHQTKVFVADRFNESQQPFMRGDTSLEAFDFDFGFVPEGPLPLKTPFTKEEALAGQKAWAKHLGKEVEFTNSVGMKFRVIPPGEFVMGMTGSVEEISATVSRTRSDAVDAMKKLEESRGGEIMPHRVQLTKPFSMQTTEVTQAQWEAVMETTPWKGQTNVNEGRDYPASYVSWDDANAFCRNLSKKEGKTYRLPTEAEWEYSCRAGTMTAFSFGDSYKASGDYAWCKDNADNDGEKYAHRVGLKRPNHFGLHDMHGNVFELCADWYDDDYYANSPLQNPRGPANGERRIIRGGFWILPVLPCWFRADIMSVFPDDQGGKGLYFRSFHGFRVVVE